MTPQMFTWPWQLGERADDDSSFNVQLCGFLGERVGVGGREGDDNEDREKNSDIKLKAKVTTEECYG